MNLLRPADLEPFLAIARHGGFRAAATALGITPSAISHALRTLEERLNLRLINRTTRSIALTEAGQRLFERIDPAFSDVNDALDELTAFRGAPMGRLRLNAAESAARLVLAPLAAGFLQAHPAVNLEIFCQNALVDMVAAGFDAGVRFGETIAPDMIAVPIGPRQRFVAVAAPSFFERWPRPVQPQDLAHVPCIRFRFDRGVDYHWEFERGGVELAIAVTGPFATNSQEVMIQAARDNIGIAFVMEGLVQSHIDSGHLVRVLEDWCPWVPGLYLYYPSRRHMPSALRAFIDYAHTRPAATAHIHPAAVNPEH